MESLRSSTQNGIKQQPQPRPKKQRPPIYFAIKSFKVFADLTAVTKSYYDFVIF